MGDTVKTAGRVEIWKNGEFLQEGKNLVVDTGLALLAATIAATAAAPSYMAIGTGATIPAATDTTLSGGQLERVSGILTSVGASFSLTAVFGSGVGAGGTVREVGIFNATSAGTMLAHFLPVPFTISSTDTVTIVWTISFVTE